MRKDVFISWSGKESRLIAEALHKWLPAFMHSLSPWMSAADILAGARWQLKVAERLKQSVFGIICVTPRNLAAPWLLFEAGALSNAINASRVCPFLVGVDPRQLPDPLAQFQAVEADSPGLAQLLHSLNQSLGEERLTDWQLAQSIEKFWPALEEELAMIQQTIAKESESRFRMIQSPLERTQAIVDDLDALIDSLKKSSTRAFVRYSGYLSPFAISNDEIDKGIKEAQGHPEREKYFHALRDERDRMITLAKHDRCEIRCIITPPTSKSLPVQVLDHTRIRLERLKQFLEDESPKYNIDWAISPFQQKNTYIVGELAYFEGLKQRAQEGYQFTLRYSADEEVSINIEMYDALFQRLLTSTLTTYKVGEQWDQRNGLRLATVECVQAALDNVSQDDPGQQGGQ